MGILAKSALFLAAFGFVSGFLITVFSASVRAVKIYLAVLAVIFGILAIAALALSRGAFVYLLFQYITVVIVLFFTIITGAACGFGLHLIIHHKTPGLTMSEQNMDDFLSLEKFIALEGVDTGKALARIKSGYYTGGRLDGVWYIHKSERASEKSRAE